MSQDEWGTPQALVDLLNEEFSFSIDVCATYANAKVRRFYTERLPCRPDVDDGLTAQNCLGVDGLARSWAGETFFMNPPYSHGNIQKWIAKAVAETTGDNRFHDYAKGVGLVRADTSTRWWRVIEDTAKEIRWMNRLRFIGAPASYNFPTALVVWDRRAGKGGPRYSYIDLPDDALGRKGNEVHAK